MDARPSFLQLFRDAHRSRMLRNLFWVSLAILAANWLFFFWKSFPLRHATDPLILHYSVLVGIDKLGAWWWVLVAPVLATGGLLVQTTFVTLLWRTKQPIAQLVALVGLAIQALFLVDTVLIILLNVGV